jgi:hypothetical protein
MEVTAGHARKGYYEVQKMTLRSLPGYTDAACPPMAYLPEGQIRQIKDQFRKTLLCGVQKRLETAITAFYRLR